MLPGHKKKTFDVTMVTTFYYGKLQSLLYNFISKRHGFNLKKIFREKKQILTSKEPVLAARKNCTTGFEFHLSPDKY